MNPSSSQASHYRDCSIKVRLQKQPKESSFSDHTVQTTAENDKYSQFASLICSSSSTKKETERSNLILTLLWKYIQKEKKEQNLNLSLGISVTLIYIQISLRCMLKLLYFNFYGTNIWFSTQKELVVPSSFCQWRTVFLRASRWLAFLPRCSKTQR